MSEGQAGKIGNFRDKQLRLVKEGTAAQVRKAGKGIIGYDKGGGEGKGEKGEKKRMGRVVRG